MVEIDGNDALLRRHLQPRDDRPHYFLHDLGGGGTTPFSGTENKVGKLGIATAFQKIVPAAGRFDFDNPLVFYLGKTLTYPTALNDGL